MSRHFIGDNTSSKNSRFRRSAPVRYIIGIDEVGRGSLAGPVVVAALAIPKNLRVELKNLPKIRDSKHLTSIQRQNLFDHIKSNPKIAYVTARVTPKVIDKINITKAANRAATKAFLRLVSNRLGLAAKTSVFLDGGLYLDIKVPMNNGYILNPKTIIRGDLRIRAIKLASVVAKVVRDKYMLRLHRRYSCYGFDRHKGYGTRAHFQAIKKYGPSPVHRLTFI
jgi:ribonuclease HII